MGNTIDDAEFFPDLHGLVSAVADRLTRLMELDRRLISALHKVTLFTEFRNPLYNFSSSFFLQRIFIMFTYKNSIKYARSA